jgi:predicted alpha/beta hydrolase
MKATTIAAADGYPLSARIFGDPRTACAGVLIVAAMGVEQQFYAPLAHWLAARGHLVLTFDYRGIGHSRRGPLRRLKADVLTWAQQDTAAALARLQTAVGDRPVAWIGHSLGGQIFGLVPGHERVHALVTVAAGSGYWRDYAPGLRYVAPLLWFVIAPLAIPLFGYFPGRRLRLIGDLPAGVMHQWRSWCLDPQYLFGVLPGRVREHYASLRLPLLSLSFTDDEYLSERNIASLHEFYAAADRTMQRIAPGDAGAPIGHFGFFRRRFEASLWPRLGEWLDRQVRTRPREG